MNTFNIMSNVDFGGYPTPESSQLFTRIFIHQPLVCEYINK